MKAVYREWIGLFAAVIVVAAIAALVLLVFVLILKHTVN